MALRTFAAAAAPAAVNLKPRTSPPLMAMSRILHRNPSSGFRRFGTPAHSPEALGLNLEQNIIDSNSAADMLILDRSKYNLSLLSIENKSLQLVQPEPPNLSRLIRSAFYHFHATCDKWVVLGSDEECITTPAEYLWDPTTDELWPIPQFQVKPRFPVEYSCYRLWGVGFDPGSGDCKVVRASHLEYVGQPEEVRGELLSVGTGSWREIRFPHDTEDMDIDDVSIHINGFYYWSAFLKDVDRNVIIPFDFGREEFPADLIPMPDIGFCRYSNSVLAEYHGSLAVIFHNYSKVDPFRFEIWVWSDVGQSWSHLSTVHVPHVTDVVGLYKSEKVILVDSQGAMLLYDCGTAELESVGVIDDCYKDDGCMGYPRYSILRGREIGAHKRNHELY